VRTLLGPIDLGSFVVAVVVVVVVGFVVFRVKIWWGKFTALFQPQTVVHKTSKTPFQVLLDSLASLGLIVGSLYALWLLYEGGLLERALQWLFAQLVVSE
jgi:hypothetical protein